MSASLAPVEGWTPLKNRLCTHIELLGAVSADASGEFVVIHSIRAEHSTFFNRSCDDTLTSPLTGTIQLAPLL